MSARKISHTISPVWKRRLGREQLLGAPENSPFLSHAYVDLPNYILHSLMIVKTKTAVLARHRWASAIHSGHSEAGAGSNGSLGS